MRQDKLTTRFQQALAAAQSLALGRDHQFIEPAHVMLALLDSSGGGVRPLLMKAGADVNKLRSGLLALLDGLPKVEGTPGEVHVSNDLNRVLNVTDKLAQQRGDQFIASELLVLAAFEDRALARVFRDASVEDETDPELDPDEELVVAAPDVAEPLDVAEPPDEPDLLLPHAATVSAARATIAPQRARTMRRIHGSVM